MTDPTLYLLRDMEVQLKVVLHKMDHNQVDNLEHMFDNYLDNSHLPEIFFVLGRTVALKEVVVPRKTVSLA